MSSSAALAFTVTQAEYKQCVEARTLVRTTRQNLGFCLLSSIDDLALHLGKRRNLRQTYLEKEFLRHSCPFVRQRRGRSGKNLTFGSLVFLFRDGPICVIEMLL